MHHTAAQATCGSVVAFLFVLTACSAAVPLCNVDVTLSATADAPSAAVHSVHSYLASLQTGGAPVCGPWNAAPLSGPVTVTNIPAAGSACKFLRTIQLRIAGRDVAATQGLLQPESFAVRAATVGADTVEVVVAGLPLDARRANTGATIGAFHVLQLLGFSFFHPLRPSIPSAIFLDNIMAVVRAPPFRSAPHWAVRGIHVHTQHPLELADVLNGRGLAGINDSVTFDQMVDNDVCLYAQWLVARRMNRLEWVLLRARDKSERWFDQSAERAARLARVANLARAFGLEAVADVAMTQRQQLAFYMIENTKDYVENIISRADWLLDDVGFDHLATELGTTEFSHTDASAVLIQLDTLAEYASQTHNATIYVKCHITAGETAKGFASPLDPSRDINFNFLPFYADRNVAVMPHTVQFYRMDGDPAPVYGNKNFKDMLQFTEKEMSRREVVYHPESAYWVNFDIDVPLLLPLYAQARVNDTRVLRAIEISSQGHRMLRGQVVFSSGFEWGYWASDAVAAVLAWEPDAVESTGDAFRLALGEGLEDVADALAEFADAQHQMLVLGNGTGFNAQAFLAGVDTWAELGCLHGAKSTQPCRPSMHTKATRAAVATLLTQTASSFSAAAAKLQGVASSLATMSATTPVAYASTGKLFDARAAAAVAAELADAASVTALRAQHVHALYAQQNIQAAAQFRAEASKLVERREALYSVDPDRIASWRKGVTAYDYGYLWTARTLYYWVRDEFRAAHHASPCYLNIIDPLIVLDDIGGVRVYDILRWAARLPFVKSIAACLAAPSSAPLPPAWETRAR